MEIYLRAQRLWDIAKDGSIQTPLPKNQ